MLLFPLKNCISEGRATPPMHSGCALGVGAGGPSALGVGRAGTPGAWRVAPPGLRTQDLLHVKQTCEPLHYGATPELRFVMQDICFEVNLPGIEDHELQNFFLFLKFFYLICIYLSLYI